MMQDYQEHQNEIHAKLVAIMSDRLAVHCGSLRVRHDSVHNSLLRIFLPDARVTSPKRVC
jgi:hypothetical protein